MAAMWPCLARAMQSPEARRLGRSGTGPRGRARCAALALAREVAAIPRLRLRGLMAVAPLGGDPAAAFAGALGLLLAVRDAALFPRTALAGHAASAAHSISSAALR